ncbi:hypothetical protein ACFL5Z_16215 [Planctomycetota bacterium]
MLAKNDLESVFSVTEMARAVDLSRARFHQLIRAGVFPPPVYDVHTTRPMYPLLLQRMCLQIRATGIGFSGRPVRFNSARKARQTRPGRRNPGGHRDLVDILRALGVRAADRDVIEAVRTLYPKGLPKGIIEASVIREVMWYLRKNCEKSV